MTTIEKLADACRVIRDYYSGSGYIGGIAQDAITAYESELAESQLPITREWLLSLGFRRDMNITYLYDSFGQRLGELNGSWWYRGFPINPQQTRGDILRLMAVLKIEPKREV